MPRGLQPIRTITPGRLNDVSNAADHVTLVQDNFEILSEELFKLTPTHQNGVPTTVIGPPTVGSHVLGELWRDSLGGLFRCTVAGTPGTWVQILPAAVAADPAAGTIPAGYVIWSVGSGTFKRHAGGYVWEVVIAGPPPRRSGFGVLRRSCNVPELPSRRSHWATPMGRSEASRSGRPTLRPKFRPCATSARNWPMTSRRCRRSFMGSGPRS